MDVFLEADKIYRGETETTLPLNPLRDKIGYVGQMYVIDYLKNNGYPMDHGDYFEGYWGDEYDFKIGERTFDVKSSTFKDGFINHPKAAYLISDHQRNKKVDCYVFVKVNLGRKEVHIIGGIEYDEFWKLAKHSKRNVKSPCCEILGKQLKPLEELLWQRKKEK